MAPILCNYYVTYRCNAKCGFCDIWEQPSPMISLEDAERNLDDLRLLGVRMIDFTGGEPLLHRDLDKLLAMARQRGFLTTVTTNGLLYPKRAESLRRNIDLLHFSIDSSDPDEHDASRGVKCFAHLMKSIETAVSLGESPDLLFTVTNGNFRHLPAIYEELALPNKLVLILNPLFEYHTVGTGLSDPVMDMMEEYGRKPYVYLNPAFVTLRRRGGNDPVEPVCKAVSTCVVISPFDELVLPCYHYGLEKLAIQGRLYELWNSERVDWHRRMEGRHDACRGCTINCYFEPSFAASPGTRYFWESIPSKVRYSWTKFIVQRMRARLGNRAAVLPDWSERRPEATSDSRPVFSGEVADVSSEDTPEVPSGDRSWRSGNGRAIVTGNGAPGSSGDGTSAMIPLPVLHEAGRVPRTS